MRELLQDGASMPRLEEIERVAIETAIARFGVTDAGHVLKIGKTTVYRKMLEYRMPSPPTRRYVPVVPFESLAPLLRAARTAADYMLRCVGNARGLGGVLDSELRRFEPAPEKTRALGGSINGDRTNGDGVAPGKQPDNDSCKR